MYNEVKKYIPGVQYLIKCFSYLFTRFLEGNKTIKTNKHIKKIFNYHMNALKYKVIRLNKCSIYHFRLFGIIQNIEKKNWMKEFAIYSF